MLPTLEILGTGLDSALALMIFLVSHISKVMICASYSVIKDVFNAGSAVSIYSIRH